MASFIRGHPSEPVTRNVRERSWKAAKYYKHRSPTPGRPTSTTLQLAHPLHPSPLSATHSAPTIPPPTHPSLPLDTLCVHNQLPLQPSSHLCSAHRVLDVLDAIVVEARELDVGADL